MKLKLPGKKSVLLFAGLLAYTSNLCAQYFIKGTVTEVQTRETTIAHVKLNGAKTLNTYTGIDGIFEFTDLPNGVYWLEIKGMGFQTILSDSIYIRNDNKSDLNFELQPESQDLSEVQILGSKVLHSESSVIEAIQTAREVVSGISQEQIKISQDGNAAQVMSRVPGVTVVDGKFVMVRGIPERYNQVLLNNAIAPSSEVDRRTFSFDLIPSNVLDRMLIYKSGAPENTGDFAGGLIKVFTAHAPTQNNTEIGISIGYNPLTTGKEFISSKGSSTDFLGFDGGFRQLPDAFPTENLRNLPNRSPKRVEAARMLPNNFAKQSNTALPDLGFNMQLDRIFNLKNIRVNTVNSIQYNQSYGHYQNEFNRYLELQPETGQTAARFSYLDYHYEKSNRISILSNWLFQLSPNHNISFKNIWNQIGENNTVIRRGEDFIQQAGLARENYMYQYRSRSIYSGQLGGDHQFPDHAWLRKAQWLVGLNYIRESQPDLRRFRTVETAPGSGEYRMILPPSSNLYDAGRYYGRLNEWGGSHALNLELQPKNWQEGSFNPFLKLGYMIDYRNRTFDTRYFSYFYPGSSSLDRLQELERLPLDQIFSQWNMNTEDGFLLEEGTRNSDNYTARNLLTAGYLGAVLPFNQLTLSGGVRLEHNSLQLQSKNDIGGDILVDYPVFSPLGFFNADYDMNTRHKLRLAYYKSVNRPEFREVAPLLFYDYEFDAEKYGNPDLKTASIDNIELRYEFYPRRGESVSLGGFYKHFKNPIETLILIRSESPAFSYQNAHAAYSTGLELEIRKALNGWTGLPVLEHMSINLNASYILSEVDYGADASDGQEAKRALQGQSPYVFNGILSYAHPDHGLQASAAYNIFGPRIYAVGSVLFPTIYELPRHSLDLTVQKTFNDWTVKFGVQDLLQSYFKFYQDTNRNNTIAAADGDHPIFYYKKGAHIQLSLNYKF